MKLSKTSLVLYISLFVQACNLYMPRHILGFLPRRETLCRKVNTMQQVMWCQYFSPLFPCCAEKCIIKGFESYFEKCKRNIMFQHRCSVRNLNFSQTGKFWGNSKISPACKSNLTRRGIGICKNMLKYQHIKWSSYLKGL